MQSSHILTFVAMTAKLVVQKIELGKNVQSLNIIITEDGSNEPRTEYGGWHEGRVSQKKRDVESSRLVVKMATCDNNTVFDLDACATKMSGISGVKSAKMFRDVFSKKPSLICLSTTALNGSCVDNNSSKTVEKNVENDSGKPENSKSLSSYKNPLEYSLERVRENNARIMQNIRLLNWTLDYTKKREDSDLRPQNSVTTYACKICGKSFINQVAVQKHTYKHFATLKHAHAITAWHCLQCLHVLPTEASSRKHASSHQCKIEIVRNVVNLMRCEFCEKVFSELAHILNHTKTHTVNSNYECSACNTTFESYTAAQKHWEDCDWIKSHYTFTLPIFLLCISCDKKFLNYDQLYFHRFRNNHCITKFYSDMTKSIMLFVYQCELCAVWFSSAPLLRVHQIKTHFKRLPEKNIPLQPNKAIP